MAGHKPIKSIGILTGGGDVPGLNPCIKTLVYRAIDDGMKVYGIHRGWGGLLHYNPDDPATHSNITKLTKEEVRTIDRSGGTYLHTSRTNPGSVRANETPEFLKEQRTPGVDKMDFTPHILRNLNLLGIDAIIPIGGDDTLSYGERLHKEGVPVVAIPKTMDNDVFGTDYCIGFSTAVNRSVNFIHALRTCTGSHERIAVVELFGRNCGETSLISAYLAWVDRAIISEVPFDVEKLARLIVEDKKANPANYAMITISEGSRFVGGDIHEWGEVDAFGHKKLGGIGMQTGEALKQLTGSGIVYQSLSYLMRSGVPDSLDLMVGVNYADIAMRHIVKHVTGRMVALVQGRYTSIPISTISSGVKRVDVRELYDVDEYRPKVWNMEGKPMFLY
ncbi:MAG: 6-phosphofructokinase [Deltaproteobacteria bacterium]|nr:6-phosphofructokinase [Deltaproteobacteria bacterium]